MTSFKNKPLPSYKNYQEIGIDTFFEELMNECQDNFNFKQFPHFIWNEKAIEVRILGSEYIFDTSNAGCPECGFLFYAFDDIKMEAICERCGITNPLNQIINRFMPYDSKENWISENRSSRVNYLLKSKYGNRIQYRKGYYNSKGQYRQRTEKDYLKDKLLFLNTVSEKYNMSIMEQALARNLIIKYPLKSFHGKANLKAIIVGICFYVMRFGNSRKGDLRYTSNFTTFIGFNKQIYTVIKENIESKNYYQNILNRIFNIRE